MEENKLILDYLVPNHEFWFFEKLEQMKVIKYSIL